MTLPMPLPAAAGPDRVLCRHCQQTAANRPRGLCWSCFYTPGVRDLYPSVSKFSRHGSGNGYGGRQLADLPTSALPGTIEKVAVLEQRARLKVSLWHPLDVRLSIA